MNRLQQTPALTRGRASAKGRRLSTRGVVTCLSLLLALSILSQPVGLRVAATNHDNNHPKVKPILECIIDNGNGTYTAWFGYKNDGQSEVTLPVGSGNKFTPTPKDRGQPTRFLPGRQENVFAVIFSGGNLVWTLDGRTEVASPNHPTHCRPVVVSISSPENNSATDERLITVSGTAVGKGPKKKSGLRVYVNDSEADFDAAAGTWVKTGVQLNVGPNVIVARAVDGDGNQASIQITVTREAPEGSLESVEPSRAVQGQSLQVTLHGRRTHWVAGQTRASFGGEVSVGGAPAGEFGPVTVIDGKTITADLSVSPTAALGPRTVRVKTPRGETHDVVELRRAFTVAANAPPGSASTRVGTLAGVAGTPGFADGAASQAMFRQPAGVATGPDDAVHVADAGNHRVRVVRPGAQNPTVWSVSTLAGNGAAGFADGASGQASFNNPQGVAVDSGGTVFVADTDNQRIRRIGTDGTISTLAGDGTKGYVNGPGAQARFNSPRGVAVDGFGNVYVADTGNSAVRRISQSGEVSTVAGDGTAGSNDSPNARFDGLSGITIDGDQIYIYLADRRNHRIRRLDSSNTVITIAGAERGFADGTASEARFARPSGIAVDGSGKLVVADAFNSLVRLVDPALASGGAPHAVTTLAGTGERGSTDGAGNVASFRLPRDLAVGLSSAVVVADTGSHLLRRILLPPAIFSLSPARARVGQPLTISGANFDARAPERNTVRFTRSAQAGGGKVSASVTFASRKELTVVVPEGAASGPVTVEVEGGTAASPVDFELMSATPQISGISPASGLSGSVVTISGTTLKASTGETLVAFTGGGGTQVPAVVSLVAETEVRAVVPSNAVTGPIYLSNAEGIAVSPVNFVVIPPPPVIEAFNPKRGPVGTLVSLSGVALRIGAAEPSVTFAGPNGTRLPALITLATPTEVRANVPAGAVSGPVALTTSAGSAQTAEPFTVELSQDFQLTASPSSATAVQRGTATFLVHVASAPQATFTGRARLSAEGLPPGVRATFAPPKLVAGATSTLTVSLSDTNLAPGSYPFNIAGVSAVDGSDLKRTTPATLNVVAGGRTTLAGRVMSTEGDPIMGATASLDGRSATTDAAGTFLLFDVTEGFNRPLMVDGRTASAPNRTYPIILEPATIVEGEANVIPYIYYLPPIDVQYEVEVVPGQTTLAQNPRVPGLEMLIPPDANLRNRDGSPVTRVSITPLAIDRTPAPLPPESGTSMIYTSQPGGAVADVAMPVIYPNLMGADPDTQVELYAFNHDTVEWYVYGYGRVSADGRTIRPEIDPSTGRPYGLADFSWHFPRGPLPDGDPGGGGGGGGGGGKGPGKGGGGGDDCPESSRGGNPVDYSSGVKIETTTDISTGGTRGGLELTRTYTSTLGQFCSNCPFGRGTTHNFNVYLTGSFGPGGAGRVVMPEERQGRLFSFTRNDPDGSRVFTATGTLSLIGDVLRRLPNGSYEYRYSDGLVMRFNAEGRLTSATDRNGETSTLTYTGDQLTKITDSLNRSITLEYEAGGRIARALDPHARAWNYSYDDGAQLDAVTDPLGNVTRYDYDSDGRLTSVVGPSGEEVKHITYDVNGRAVEQKLLGVGVERYEYTLSGGVVTSTTITKPNGETTTKRFNAAGYVIGVTDEAGQEIRYGRDILTNLATTTSGPCDCSEGSRQYDAKGNLLTLTDPNGQSERYEYDPTFGNITKMTDKSGRSSDLTYDERGNNTSLKNELGEITRNTYDEFGQLTSVTDPRGRVTRYEYDAAGNQTAVVDIAGTRTTMEYDAKGRMTARVDALGRRSTATYDDFDRVTSETNEMGVTTTYTYDERGNRLTATDELNNVWRMGYDDKNRLVSRTDPLGRVSLMRYNASGKLRSMVSPLGRTTRFTFDQNGRPATATDPNGGVLTYSYDKNGKLLSLKDQRGHTTTFTYDESFRVVARRDSLGLISSTTYDPVTGNVTEKADRLGRRVSYSYDAQNRISAINFADAMVTYTYDAAGRLTRIDDSQSGSIVRVYDDLDRLVSETTPAGAVTYTYNAAGQRTSLKADDRTPVSYAYDAAGRLQTITQGADSFTFAYDELSRLQSLQRPNGVTTSYEYNALGQLTRITHTNAAAGVLEQFGYGYDLDGRIHSVTSPFGDTLHAPEATASEANAANRIGRHGAASFTFNQGGESTAKTDEQGATGYDWDARGRLTQVTLPGGQTVGYAYDANGRRLSQTVGGVTTHFLYDGKDVVLDKRSDGASVEYLNSLNLDDKLRQSSEATGPLYFLPDLLGSTTALADAGGNVVERQRYEAYGANAGSALTRYGFTGRERDALTGLLYYRARWYDPRQGRFLTEDPAGFEGGTNLYEYAGGNPISLTDPLGNWPTQRLGPGTGIRPLGGHTHQNSIQRVVGPFLPSNEVEELKHTQHVIDTTDNDLDDAHKHAMTTSGATYLLAYSLANKWIKEHMIAARCYARNNQRMEAMRELGLAMHTMQDHTSPAHNFFIVWEGGGGYAWMGPYFKEVYGFDGSYGTPEYIRHMLTENFDPGANSQLDFATHKAYLFFRGLPLVDDFLRGIRADPGRWIPLGASDED